jgi:KaiC/GvpD/RAD55 family RecA-like ATPase
MAKEYSAEIQKFFLEVMMQNAENFIRVQNIYNAENFDRSLRATATFIREHSEQYSILPRYEQIKATTGVDLKPIPDLDEGHSQWFLDEFESFTRRQELERAILKAADLLEKGDYDPVEQLIKSAVQISLTKDMGTDYFADPAARLNKYFTTGGQVSTGWPQMDRLLYGGFSRGELNIFAGGSGSGKSLVMMNIALSWLQAGLNGVYVTLELSEELTSLRTDAMLTSMSTKEIRKSIDDTSLKVAMHGKKFGKYQIKALPAQSNINDIRAYIKEFQIKKGIKIDFVMVDYLDLLMPVSAKVNPNDLFVKDKYVSEELRNLAKELGVLFVTASQLNRSAVEEVEFDHSHISGGISKINTADNVFGIFTSRTMRERGKYQIQCMKSRSSTGVGQKIELEYNIDTMRITDPGESASSNSGNQVSSIMDRIKNGGAASGSGTGKPKDQPWEKPKAKEGFDITQKYAGTGGVPPTGTAQSTILKGMLAGLKSKD